MYDLVLFIESMRFEMVVEDLLLFLIYAIWGRRRFLPRLSIR
jgi:hypothetical protein